MVSNVVKLIFYLLRRNPMPSLQRKWQLSYQFLEFTMCSTTIAYRVHFYLISLSYFEVDTIWPCQHSSYVITAPDLLWKYDYRNVHLYYNILLDIMSITEAFRIVCQFRIAIAIIVIKKLKNNWINYKIENNEPVWHVCILLCIKWLDGHERQFNWNAVHDVMGSYNK